MIQQIGPTANRFWTRDKFKDTKSLYRAKNATRIPIEEKESYRWVEGLSQSNNGLKKTDNIIHVGDRGGDLYEFFSHAIEEESYFLVRIKVGIKVDRRTENEEVTIFDRMSKSKILGRI